jgi:hypothetical protein
MLKSTGRAQIRLSNLALDECRTSSCSEAEVKEQAPGGFAAKVLSHGVAGGVMNSLQGGKFGHGFVSAGVAQAASGMIDGIDPSNIGFSPSRTFAAAMLGGSVSAASGGKFASGAATAAFSRAFNDEMHERSAFKEYFESVGNVLDEYGEGFNNFITSEPLVNMAAGAGDGFSLGLTSAIRDSAGIGSVDQSSAEYRGTRLVAELVAPTGRLAYIKSVRSLKFLEPTLENAKLANGLRNQQKRYFRGPFAGLFKDYKSFQVVAAKYNSNSAILSAASRTNPYFNALAAAAATKSMNDYRRRGE